MTKFFYESEFPIDTRSEANTREHWSMKARRAKAQRREAHYWCRIKFGMLQLTPMDKVRIKLIRLSPKTLDSDNLACAFKAIRDGIADYLGIDDGSERLEWEYDQEYLAKTRTMKVILSIEN